MPVTSPRASFYRVAAPVPLDWPDEEEHRRKIAEGVERALNGKVRSVGSITLTANAASSTLTDEKIGPLSFIALYPTTANAAAIVAATYVSARTDKSATITHTNNANADKTFMYVVLG